ncbi:hypothetical protein NC652_003191 [Populus alba x Populus x berolinensis]|nr:hypothetical protein NC652_003191 [Populus alba x Populus x berolinensis]
MVLRKRKAKIKLITCSSSLQPAMAGQDDDFSCSMDFGIRQGNIRNTQPNPAAETSDTGEDAAVEGMLHPGQTLGFGNTCLYDFCIRNWLTN